MRKHVRQLVTTIGVCFALCVYWLISLSDLSHYWWDKFDKLCGYNISFTLAIIGIRPLREVFWQRVILFPSFNVKTLHCLPTFCILYRCLRVEERVTQLPDSVEFLVVVTAVPFVYPEIGGALHLARCCTGKCTQRTHTSTYTHNWYEICVLSCSKLVRCRVQTAPHAHNQLVPFWAQLCECLTSSRPSLTVNFIKLCCKFDDEGVILTQVPRALCKQGSSFKRHASFKHTCSVSRMRAPMPRPRP